MKEKCGNSVKRRMDLLEKIERRRWGGGQARDLPRVSLKEQLSFQRGRLPLFLLASWKRKILRGTRDSHEQRSRSTSVLDDFRDSRVPRRSRTPPWGSKCPRSGSRKVSARNSREKDFDLLFWRMRARRDLTGTTICIFGFRHYYARLPWNAHDELEKLETCREVSEFRWLNRVCVD